MGLGRLEVLVTSVNSNMTGADRKREAANLGYFQSLAESRASLTGFPMVAGLNMIFLGLGLLFLYSAVYVGATEFQPMLTISVSLMWVNLLLFLMGIIRPMLFRFQIVFSSLLAILVANMGYSLCLLALVVGTMASGNTFALNYSLDQYALFGIIALLYVVGATFVHVLLLRRRLRVGHSEKRTMGNLLAASSVYRSKSLWIIFGVALIGPNLLTGGEYVMLTFGGVMFLLFASVLTSLPVEFGYLAYLKSKDKRYWEVKPPKILSESGVIGGFFKKIGKGVLFVVGGFVALLILGQILGWISNLLAR